MCFSSRISASSLGKMDADNTTLITEATTKNYLVQNGIFIRHFNLIKLLTKELIINRMQCNTYDKNTRHCNWDEVRTGRNANSDAAAVFLLSYIFKLKAGRFLYYFQLKQYEAFAPHFETGRFQCDSFRFRSFLPDANMADVQLPGGRGKQLLWRTLLSCNIASFYIYRWNTRIYRFARLLNGVHLPVEREQHQISELLSDSTAANWQNVTLHLKMCR